MKKLLFVVALLCGISTGSVALASLIYSTPNPTYDEVVNDPGSHSAPSLGSYQWLATEIHLSQQTNVSRIRGWMMESAQNARPVNALVNAVIYSDGGAVPGTELYRAPFLPGDALGWYGPDNLGWNLGQGSYWLAFEVDRNFGSTYAYEYMMLTTTDYTIANAAWNYGHPTPNYSPGGSDLGVEIFAETVPEPSTLILLGGGLAGVALLRRRGRK